MLGNYIYLFLSAIWSIFDVNFTMFNYNWNLQDLIISLLSINLGLIVFIKIVFNTSVASGFESTTNSETGETSRKFVFGKRSR